MADKDNADKNEQPKDDKPKDEKVSPTRQRQDAKREQNIAEFERQVQEGSVVVRQMTPAERKANPPRDAPPKKPRKR
jgi:hypothetical protein